jgi:subtilisin family serine protease
MRTQDMAARPKRRVVILAALAVAGIAAACTPVTQPPPPPAPTPTPVPKPASTASTNCPTGTGSGTTSASYVAVVEQPGDSVPEVYTFEAQTQAQQNAAVDELEKIGEVVSVEPDAPVSVLEEGPTSTTASSTTTTSTPAPSSTSSTTPPSTPQPGLPVQPESVEAEVTTNDPNYGSQYGLVQSGFPAAWSAGYDGAGTTIAIIDTGVQANHPDLTGHVLSGYDFVCGKAGTSFDPHGHGTHVAGIAAARDNSVFGLGGAPEASILPVRVLSSSGSGSNSDVAAGIYWAVDNGADVINLSLGGSSASTAVQDAVTYAEAQGVVVVAAAGNSNSDAKSYPGGFDGEVIAVGATAMNTPAARASFSNYGSWVDIGAPGRSVQSTDTGSSFTTKSGTSMATPFAAAAAALILQKCGSVIPDQVLADLQAWATPIVTSTEGGGLPSGMGGAKHLRIDLTLANVC